MLRENSQTTGFTKRKSDKTLSLYLNDIGKYPLITAEEEISLYERIKAGDEQARDRLVEGNLRFVVCIAKRYGNRRLSLLDLINEGNIGLMEASRRFDPDRKVKFLTYAVWWIRQAILQALAVHGFAVRLPLKRANLNHRITKNEERLRKDFQREPTAHELADQLNEKLESVENVRRASRVCMSVEVLMLDDEQKNMKVVSQLTRDFDAEEKILTLIMQQEIKQVMDFLSSRESTVIHLHYGLDRSKERLTLKEIGNMMGLTKEGVRQIEKRATRKLKMLYY